MMRCFFLFSIAFLFLFSACKKTEEVVIAVDISRPVSGSSFCVGDSVRVVADISSESKIDYVKVALLNENMVNVCSSISVYPQSKSCALDVFFELSNREISNGNYNFMIEVSCGQTVERAYRQVYVSAIPKESVSLLSFCCNSGDSLHIYKIDSLLNSSLFLSLRGDFGGAAVNSFSQYIYTIGKYTGSFRFINANSGEVAYEIPAVVMSSYPYFNCIDFSENLITVGFYQGFIKSFYVSSMQKSSSSIENYRPLKTIYDGKYLICSLQYRLNNRTAIAVVFESSRMLNNLIETQFSVVEMFRAGGNDVVIFANSASGPDVYTLDVERVVLTHQLSLPQGNIISAVQIDNDDFVISYDNGLLKYNLSTNNSTDFVMDVSGGKLCFDEVDRVLYLANGKTIRAFSLSGESSVLPELPDSIIDLHILYNI